LAAWSARRPDTRTRSDHHPARSRRAGGNNRGRRPEPGRVGNRTPPWAEPRDNRRDFHNPLK